MKVYCPNCRTLIGHFAQPKDAEGHYKAECPYCGKHQTDQEKAKVAAHAKAKGSVFAKQEELAEE